MKNELHLDFETRSAVDLKKTGAYVYAEDKTTDIWCAAYALGDEAPRLWRPGLPVAEDAAEHIRSGGIVKAHNAAFERAIWHHIFGPRYGWPTPKVEQWRCTMAMSLAMSLPGALEKAALALGLDYKKDMAGHRLMLQMAKPRKINADGSITWWDVEEKKQRLFDYCKTDIVVERALDKRLVDLRPSEWDLWHLDQVINDRGVHVDLDLCAAAKDVVTRLAAEFNDDMREVTGLEVTACSNVQQLLTFVRKNLPEGAEHAKADLAEMVGNTPLAKQIRVKLPEKVENMQKATVSELLVRDDLSEKVRRALEIRQEAGKASVSKIDTLMKGTNLDQRARGLFQFCGADTGRWAGRRFQPHNLKRPDSKQTVIEFVIELMKRGDIDLFFMMQDKPLDTVGDCLRAMVRSAPGKKLVSADFSNIEGRVIAWLAGEAWKIKAFREFDAGIGPDLYILAYALSFGVDVSEIKSGDPRRQVGKVEELSMGFQGGVGAFQQMARVYGVNIGESYDLICRISDPALVEQAKEAYETRGRSSGIVRETWVAAEIVKLAWRAAHPMVVKLWHGMEEAAINAVKRPGTVTSYGLINFRMRGSFLFMQLPSGRLLTYPYPKIVQVKTPWGKMKDQLTYKGKDSKKQGKWGLQTTYGGKLTENAVQAIARDVLAYSMPKIEAAGYPIVLHVHDELVSEVPEDFGSVKEYEQIMSEVPPWAEGLPVVAAGWSGVHYRK